jgi:hypothetical protein
MVHCVPVRATAPAGEGLPTSAQVQPVGQLAGGGMRGAAAARTARQEVQIVAASKKRIVVEVLTVCSLVVPRPTRIEGSGAVRDSDRYGSATVTHPVLHAWS